MDDSDDRLRGYGPPAKMSACLAEETGAAPVSLAIL
jgi:hypothetical protein